MVKTDDLKELFHAPHSRTHTHEHTHTHLGERMCVHKYINCINYIFVKTQPELFFMSKDEAAN